MSRTAAIKLVERTHICLYQDCSYTFYSESNLKLHLRKCHKLTLNDQKACTCYDSSSHAESSIGPVGNGCLNSADSSSSRNSVAVPGFKILEQQDTGVDENGNSDGRKIHCQSPSHGHPPSKTQKEAAGQNHGTELDAEKNYAAVTRSQSVANNSNNCDTDRDTSCLEATKPKNTDTKTQGDIEEKCTEDTNGHVGIKAKNKSKSRDGKILLDPDTVEKCAPKTRDQFQKSKSATTDRQLLCGVKKTDTRTLTEVKEQVCGICQYRSTRAGSLKKHIQTKHSGEKLICRHCAKRFKTRKILATHEKRHTQEGRYKCRSCPRAFHLPGALANHEACAHSGERPFQCDQCQKTFSLARYLLQHKTCHVVDRSYKCDVCGAAFSTMAKLRRHISTHSSRKPYECKICCSSFSNTHQLKRHALIHSSERLYQCDVCKASFKQPATLTKHKRIHAEEKPFKCEHCFATFTQRNNLNTHMVIHSRAVDRTKRPYSCDVCRASFTSIANMKRHQKRHTSEYAFVCKHCAATFTMKVTLTKHMDLCKAGSVKVAVVEEEQTLSKNRIESESHIKSSPNSLNLADLDGQVARCDDCSETRCTGVHNKQPLTFAAEHGTASPDSEKKHQTSDHGDGQSISQKKSRKAKVVLSADHKCHQCDRVFTKKSNLVRHIFNLHSKPKQQAEQEKPFSCERCAKGFLWQKNLNRHKRAGC